MVVGGFNFGTGSSREQAVTALKCKGIPLVIAGSFSQTYLRNAFNNGFLCIEAPELVQPLARDSSRTRSRAKRRPSFLATRSRSTLPPAPFATPDEEFAFPALGSVPQSLVIAGGVENLVSQKLAESCRGSSEFDNVPTYVGRTDHSRSTSLWQNTLL